MNFKTTVFTLSLLSSLVLQDAFAGHMDDFTPEEQQLIKKFYIVATEFGMPYHRKNKQVALKNAREIIETAPREIPNYGKTNFSITDLFTTTCDIEVVIDNYPQKRAEVNYFSDYLGIGGSITEDESEFFEYILQHIQHVDTIKDLKGRTILMKLANALAYQGRENNDKNILHCFSALLKKGANPRVQDNEGRDALTLALLAQNTSMVNLIMEHLKQHHDSPLSDYSKTLLAIHQGEFVVLDSPNETLLKDMYRVANQSKNYKMVDSLYKFFNREELFNTLKPAYYFHPPLWAYNISQLKEYAVSRVKEFQEHRIDENKIIPVDLKNNLYEYNDGMQKLLLKKKSMHDVGRILGRNHLERVIQQEGVQAQLAVPRKFLTVPNVQKIEVVLKIPTGSTDCGLDFGHPQENPMGMEITGATVYAEFIKNVSNFKLLENDPIVRKVGEAAGFADYGHGSENFSLSAENNKIYFIDTEDRKNFTARWWEGLPDTEDAPLAAIKSYAEIKSYCFDPRLKYISIPLSPEDFN